MPNHSRFTRGAASCVLAALAVAAAGAVPAAAAVPAPTVAPVFTSRVFASGAGITHAIPGGSEAVNGIDDITSLNSRIFVAFQNGVGAQGQASSTGNLDSTVVEFDAAGTEVAQWDLVGKVDGLTADPAMRGVIATVNEDANSSLYVIYPNRTSAVHFSYDETIPSAGGTDAITIDGGRVLISASAPGTTGTPAPQPSYPAVYQATFHLLTRSVNIAPLFYDEALAFEANLASFLTPVHLALTDPDSSELVPSWAVRFAGDFMLTSQGDQQQIFVHDAGSARQWLSVLNLPASVDDTAWPSAALGTLYATDSSANMIYALTGPFVRGDAVTAVTPCDSNSAPSTCPGPGFPPNYLATVNEFTGALTPLTLSGPAIEPKSLLFLP